MAARKSGAKPPAPPPRTSAKSPPNEAAAAAASAGAGAAGPWTDGLFDTNVELHQDLVCNIPGIRRSQHLFDDLSTDPADWRVAIAAEGAERIPTPNAVTTRPFDYGTVITYSLQAGHWQASRFSDASRYGVWYGAPDTETTVYETAWHWRCFVLDSYAGEEREITSERRLFDVRCDALLIDLRGKEAVYPALVSRRSYDFCQRVGRYIHEQGLNGLLYRSARCEGVNAAVFKAERLGNVRDKLFLTYRYNPATDRIVVERTPGRTWLSFDAGALG